MDVDFTVRYPVDTTESIGKVPCSRIEIGIRAGEIGEMFGHWRHIQFPLEQVNLVQEEDDGFPFEPLAIGKGLEKHHSLMHLILAQLGTSSDDLEKGQYSQHSGLPPNIGRIRTTQP